MDITQETATYLEFQTRKREWGRRTTYNRYISDCMVKSSEFFKETYALQNLQTGPKKVFVVCKFSLYPFSR